MAYVDTLLTSNEHVIYRTKKHWIAPLFATIPGSLLTIGGLVLVILYFVFNNQILRNGTLWLGTTLLVVGLALVGWSFMRWLSQEYVVTNNKVIKAQGWIKKKSEGASLDKINEIEMEQSLLGRTLNYGTLKVRTASDTADLRYWVMRDPQEFRKQILEAKAVLEQADARFIADAVNNSAAAHAISSNPARDPEPIDIPEMISKLAALRDAGAITSIEFETKKADLLKRL